MEGHGFIRAEPQRNGGKSLAVDFRPPSAGRPSYSLGAKTDAAFVSTKAFRRPQDRSPSGQGYHWNSNAETYYLIGEAIADAMRRLIDVPP